MIGVTIYDRNHPEFERICAEITPLHKIKNEEKRLILADFDKKAFVNAQRKENINKLR